MLNAIDKRTGHLVWSRRLGQLSASSPAVTANTVYVTILYSGHPNSPGRVIALNSANGAVRWWRALPSGSESSPLLDDGRVFFGSQNGTVYALNDRNGALLWTYHAACRRQGQPHAVGRRPLLRRLLRAPAGDLRADRAAAVGQQLRRRAAGQRHVLLDRRRRLRARLPWQHRRAHLRLRRVQRAGSTGRCRPAPTCTPRPPSPTPPASARPIYLGSYNGTFYAINARTGHVSWRFNAHGRISGSATIVGRTVYFADLGTHRTYGLGISTGRVLFEDDTGAFDPVISDGTNIYLTGYSGLFGLAPAEHSRHSQRPSAPSRMPQRPRTARLHGGRLARTARAAGAERPRQREAGTHDRRPRGLTLTSVHPPGAGATQPLPRVSVQ